MENKTIYISSRKNIKEYIQDNFVNTIFISSAPFKSTLKKIINKVVKENICQVIIEDYFIGIKYFVKELNNKNITVKVVWTGGLATLIEEIDLGNLLTILDLLKFKQIKCLAFTDVSMYETYKDLKNVMHIKLTVKNKEKIVKEKTNNICVYGDAYNWQSNIFNQLSAIKLMDNYKAFLLDVKNIARRFCNSFEIKNINFKKKTNVTNIRLSYNHFDIASCVEFSNLYDLLVIDTYNHGIPVVLGNNNLFFKGTELEKMVIVSSDDDINEIALKMKYCLENIEQINNIYIKEKENYDKEVKKLIEKFVKE